MPRHVHGLENEDRLDDRLGANMRQFKRVTYLEASEGLISGDINIPTGNKRPWIDNNETPRTNKKARIDETREQTAMSSTVAKSSRTIELKDFSLQTPKYHMMGDYPSMIRLHGSCDSYNTQIVS